MVSTDLGPWMQALLIIAIDNLCVHMIHLVYQLHVVTTSQGSSQQI